MGNELVRIAAGDKIAIYAKPDRTPYTRRGHCYRVAGNGSQAPFKTFDKAWARAMRWEGPEQVDGVDLTDAELAFVEACDEDDLGADA